MNVGVHRPLIAKRSNWEKAMGAKDPTAHEAVAKLSPLPVLRCMAEGQTFLVEWPERWLQVIESAFRLYEKRFGSKAAETMKHRYQQGWTRNKILAMEGISKGTYIGRRTFFLHCLILMAVQEGLIKVDGK